MTTFVIKDKNLTPENIKSGVKILKVTGTYEGGGQGDCEEWPSLLGVHNGQSTAHAGVIFDTGFPIADGHINDYFNGFFCGSYDVNNSFFLFGNRSNVDPETGHYYYWGAWNYQDKLIVSFGGGGGESAVFTLGPSMNDYDVPVWDLPISWVRTENMDYGSPDDEYGTEYIYEVKVGNLIKYAPAFDDRLEFFDGLNMCVFGRDASGGYGASAPDFTRCSKITVESADGEHNAYEMELKPYVKNGTATLMKHYTDFTAGEETEEPLEPILHEGAETISDNFFIYHDPYQAGIEVTPSTKEQHIDTVSNTDVFPYVTVLPMNLASASETITENGQVVISAGDYGADGISEITLDVSVDAGGGSDWLADALAGNITDLSGYSLPAPTHNYQYYYLFDEYPSITALPDMSNWTSISGNYCMYQAFYRCTGITPANLDMSGLTTVTGDYALRDCFNAVPISSVDLSGLTTVTGQAAFRSCFRGCTSLTYVDLRNLSTVSGNGKPVFQECFSICSYLDTIRLDSLQRSSDFNGMFNFCSRLKTVYISTAPLAESSLSSNPLYDVTSIENLYLTDNTSGNVRLDWQPNLTAASVLNVLTHLSATHSSGAFVSFYLSGLTVTDDAQGSVQTARDAAVANGWDIRHLTIVQP